MKTIEYIQPLTPLIGRETPGLTYAIFRSLALKDAARKRKTARRLALKQKIKSIFTFQRCADVQATIPL